MKWQEIKLHTTTEAVEPITNILHEAGVSGVVITDPHDLKRKKRSTFTDVFNLNPKDYPTDGAYVTFYLPSDEEIDDQLRKIKKEISALVKYDIDIGHNKMSIWQITEEDWSTSWQKYYHTIQITNRITIKPKWEEYEPKSPQELIISLDPGMAFGTGTHPTTKLSIQALEKYVKKDDLVIDVGCGSGVLSVIAGRLGAGHVYSLDVDDIAIKSTQINAALNDVLRKLDIKKNNLLKGFHTQANLIVSNILAEIIIQFPADAYNNLKKEGIFITSGIIKRKKDVVINHLKDVGFTILEVNTLDDWVCIIAKK